jgi:hypothetical protein
MRDFNKEYCNIIIKDNSHYIIDPNGNEIEIPCIISTVVSDDYTEHAPTCTIKFYVNIGQDL